jgi:ubiquinone biosynthesis protein COQ4
MPSGLAILTGMRNPLRAARLFWSVARLAGDLGRLQRVFEINDQIMRMRTEAESAAVVREFAASPAGAEALRDRHHFGRPDRVALRALAEDTVGGAYARFLDREGIDPEALPEQPAGDELEYIVAHLYATHDLWHVLVGFGTDPAGELGLQAFLLAQTRSTLPFFALTAGLLNTVLYDYDQKAARLDAIARGWQLGRTARNLAGIDWRPQLARPLADVRRELGLS